MKLISPQAYWFHNGHLAAARFQPLQGDRTVDVAIVGGGITGLTAAYHLKRAGRRVAVLEAGQVGAGTTGGTSGHLDCHPDVGFDKLVHDYGESSAAAICAARLAAIDWIERFAQDHQIECDVQRIPGFLYAEDDQQQEQLVQQHDAARQCGVDARLTTDIPLPFPCQAGIRLERQGRFHVMDYLQGLANQVHGDKGEIFEQTRVLHPPEDAGPCVVPTEHGEVRADHVILATHSPFLGVSVMDPRVAPYQSYVVTAEIADPNRQLADALYWDLASPYHYLRRASSDTPDLWIIGGADHKTGQGDEEQSFAKLEQFARNHFQVTKIHQRWSAELFEPSDGAPFIGRVPRSKHLYLATGFSGTGLTWGTVAGELLADLILERDHALQEIVSPSRIKPLAAAKDLVTENANVANRFVMDRYDAEHPERLGPHLDLQPGDGRVVRYENELIAVCKDESGAMHACTATCTHAGCIVQWNGAERTWDCPCHGGRYDHTGRRIYGPPAHDLAYRNAQSVAAARSSAQGQMK